jgi:hypothetical protein
MLLANALGPRGIEVGFLRIVEGCQRHRPLNCKLHTSKNDWLNLVWTLKSFYISSGRRYALCIS